MQSVLKRFVPILLLAVGYIFSSWLMERISLVYGSLYILWPASGIALFCVARYGMKVWPGVAAGSILTHLWLYWNNPEGAFPGFLITPALLFIAAGSVLEAQAGAFILNRWMDRSNPFNRVRDALIFVAAAFFMGGVRTLFGLGYWVGLGKQVDFLQADHWVTWWLGDTLGILIVGPLFFISWSLKGMSWKPVRVLEVGLLLGLFYVSSQIVFGEWLKFVHYPLVYMLFPCLVWAAGRFEQQGTALMILLVSATAIWGTLSGRGPFAEHSVLESFRLLQFYLMVLAVMTLIICAAVTEAQAAQRRSARLGRILNESMNEIYVFDAHTQKFLEVSAGALMNLGYTMEEMSGMGPLDIKPSGHKNECGKQIASMVSGAKSLLIFESMHQRKDGSVYPIEIRSHRSKIDSQEVFVSLGQDLSWKKQAEKSLRDSEERFKQLAENLDEVFWMIDRETGKILYVSPSYETVWGQKREQVYIDPKNWMKSIHPEDIESVERDFPRDIFNKGVVDMEYRIIRPDGSIRWIWDRGFPVRNEEGNIYRVAGYAADITEKKNTQVELNQYRNQLEELVEKRTEALEATHRQLIHAEKLSASGKLAASMAHEFNNPIFGIRNILEKTRRNVEMDPKYQRFINLAIRECDRVSQLIQKMLAFHRPSSETREVMDIHESIDDMLVLTGKKFQEKNIELVIRYGDRVPRVEAVPDQISQVILNLLQNAEEALPESGGKIEITTRRAEPYVEIRIQDNGPGIPQQIGKSVFDPFFTTKDQVKGTGLGLSVSYGIIQTHGGDIRFESPPDQGTVFIVRLPMAVQKVT